MNSGELQKRPDLALLYYPPVTDLYWFLSRTVYMLHSYPKALPFESLYTIRDILSEVMRGNATTAILQSAHVDRHVFWQDFIGLNDTDWLGYADPHLDDALFTTSVALNALIDTWTSENDQCKRNWIRDTPADVIDAVNSGISWIKEAVNSDYALYNAFFSGSMKGMEQNTYAFPANLYQYINGSNLPPDPGNNLNSLNADLAL